jgi:hypothetical protein
MLVKFGQRMPINCFQTERSLLQMKKRILLVLLSALTGDMIAAEVPASIENLYTLDLQHKFGNDEAKLVKSGEQEFLTLQKTAMTSYTKGTVILVPDWSQHAASPRAIDMLRQQLVDYGWNTMSLLVPEIIPQPDTENMLVYQDLLAQRLAVMMEQAKAPYQNIVVIAQGSSGALLNQLYQSEKLTAPQGLILLSAYLADQTLNQSLSVAMARHQVPTLDIQQQVDHPFAMAQSQLRLQLVRKHLKNSYRQRLLPGSIDDSQYQHWLFKEVYGWLNAQGF